MGKLETVKLAIDKMREFGGNPTVIKLSRSYAIALKREMFPNTEEHFINGRMTCYGVPWEIEDHVKGFYLFSFSENSSEETQS